MNRNSERQQFPSYPPGNQATQQQERPLPGINVIVPEREKPARRAKKSDLKTKYCPRGTLVQIIPFAPPTSIGSIILPPRSQVASVNEGTVIDIGDEVPTSNLGIGDTVTWDENTEYRMDVDGERFVLTNHQNIIMRIPVADLPPDVE
jgi:co-chaperonin GroES (HSP10)